MKIFLDGKWIGEKEAKAPVYEPGFLSAQGLFETMRANGGKIFCLDEHLQRLIESAPAIKINLTYSKEKLRAIINKALRLNHYPAAYVRLTVWAGRHKAHTSLIVKEYRPYSKEIYAQGFSAIISRARQDETSILANIKTSSRLHFLLAESQAKQKGADEAILLNTKGNIAEGARANIFLVKNSAVFTPDKESGCLLGITRQAVLAIAKKEKIKTYEKKVSPGDLFEADEAFLTNSLIGIMPLTLADNKKIGRGKTTAFFMKRYHELTLPFLHCKKGKVILSLGR